MVKLKFDEEKKEWIKLPKGSKEGIYLDNYLLKKLENVKAIIKKNYDCVFLIDGKERIGKSTLGMLCGWYLSNTKINTTNFATGCMDASKKIKELPNKDILIVDEGSLVFSSKDAMRKELKQLIKILDVCGQKNMIFIIILPCFFDLIKSIATRRSRFLLHCYSDDKLNRGRFAYFGEREKQILYEFGKKNFGSYRKPSANFIGRFTDFNPPFYNEYLKIKNKSLIEALDTKAPLSERETKINFKREFVLANQKNKDKLSTVQLANLFGVSTRTIVRYAKGGGL